MAKKYIKDDIIQPFHGDSEITSRASTDAAYQSELLQTSSIRIEPTSGKAATTYERRVFRLLQGKLLHGKRSVWNANAGNGVVKGNLTDVELGNEVQEPKGHGQNRWQDVEFGPRKPPLMDVVVYLYFYLSDAPYWEMSHSSMATSPERMMQEVWDRYSPKPGGEYGGIAARMADKVSRPE